MDDLNWVDHVNNHKRKQTVNANCEYCALDGDIINEEDYDT